MQLLMPSKSNLTFVTGKKADQWAIPDNALKFGSSILVPFELKPEEV